MNIFKKTNSVTPATRNLIQLQLVNLSKFPLLKKKLKKKKKSLGKNNLGQITMYHRGGGVKRKYRKIDFFRNTDSISIVISIEYDPNRTSFIAALYDIKKKIYSYIIAPQHLKIGDIVKSGEVAELKLGHTTKLSNISVGTSIHNITIKKNGKAVFTRSAGTKSFIIDKHLNYCKVIFTNGKIVTLSPNCNATIGAVSNENNNLISLGKAGRSRWMNNRPIVRGVAMNPIDHPHGGGEGKTSGGKSSVTPWGKPCK